MLIIRTVPLNWIMCNARQHGKAIIFTEIKFLRHPWIVVSQGKMSSSNAFVTTVISKKASDNDEGC